MLDDDKSRFISVDCPEAFVGMFFILCVAGLIVLFGGEPEAGEENLCDPAFPYDDLKRR